ncbi:MAG: hypothetical protein ACXVRE_04500 [Gaiellaceae bacterium]
MKAFRIIGLLVVVAATVALAGGAFASKGSKPVRGQQAPRMHAAKSHSTVTLRTPSRPSTESSDTDNVQSGDQTTPDSQGEQPSGSESESGSDAESGQPGEPAQGHEDPAGQDVNHECTGNCQE